MAILASAMHICTDSYILSLASDHVYELRSILDTEDSWAHTRKGSAYGRHFSIRTNDKSPGTVSVAFEGQDIGLLSVRTEAETKQLLEFVHYWNGQVGPTDATTARIAELFGDYQKLSRSRQLSISAVTWNCGGTLADFADSKAFKFLPTTDVVIVAIQESDQLNRSITASSTTQTTASDAILGALGASLYSLVSSVQLLGIMTLVLVRKNLEQYISDKKTDTTSTGFMGVWGNKGAVLSSFKLFNDQVLGDGIEVKVANCHLSAGDGSSQMERRRWELSEIAHRFKISGLAPSSKDLDFAAAAAEYDESEISSLSDVNDSVSHITMAYDDYGDGKGAKSSSPKPSEGGDDADTVRPERSNHLPGKLTIVLGDLNYRVLLDENKAKSLVSEKKYDQLLQYDTLRKEISNRTIFRGFEEAPIAFPPTYKYDLGTSKLSTRIPSYTDRIFYVGDCTVESYDSVDQRQSDHRPVILRTSVNCNYIDNLERGTTVGRSLRLVDAAENRVRPRLGIEPATSELTGGPFSRQAVWLTLSSEIIRPLSWIVSVPENLHVVPNQGELTPGNQTTRILVQATMPFAKGGDPQEIQSIIVISTRNHEHLEKYVCITLKTLPSCIGASLEKMCLMSQGARNEHTKELTTNLPKQIWACTHYLTSRFSNELLGSSSYPSVFDQVLNWLDEGQEFDEEVLDSANRDHGQAGSKAVWHVLLAIFEYLPTRLLSQIDSSDDIFSKLPPVSANVLAFIVGFAKQLVNRGIPLVELCDSLAKVLFDTDDANDSDCIGILRELVDST